MEIILVFLVITSGKFNGFFIIAFVIELLGKVVSVAPLRRIDRERFFVVSPTSGECCTICIVFGITGIFFIHKSVCSGLVSKGILQHSKEILGFPGTSIPNGPVKDDGGHFPVREYKAHIFPLSIGDEAGIILKVCLP